MIQTISHFLFTFDTDDIQISGVFKKKIIIFDLCIVENTVMSTRAEYYLKGLKKIIINLPPHDIIIIKMDGNARHEESVWHHISPKT